MGIFDDIKSSFIGSTDDEEEKVIEKKESATPKTAKPPESTEKIEKEQAPDNVFNFNSSAAFKNESSSARQNIQPRYSKSEIKTIRPKNFDDAQTVSNLLRDNITVIMNLEETDSKEAQRIVDFISGTTYAVDGDMKPISQKVFICAPNVVKVESYEDEKKSKGSFF